MKLEQTFGILIRTVHLLSLIWSLASHLRMKHLQTKFAVHMTVLHVVFDLIDVIDQHTSILFTDLAGIFTDHSKSGRPILAKYMHFRTT